MTTVQQRICEFGYPGALRDRLVGAVLDGSKTATSALRAEWVVEGEELPSLGEREIVVDSAGRPVATIEVVRVEVIRLADADDRLAVAEGESYETAAGWRAEHERFWEEEVLPAWPTGTPPSIDDDTQVVVQWFRLVDPAPRAVRMPEPHRKDRVPHSDAERCAVREASVDDLPGILRLYGQLHADDPALEPATAAALFAQIADTPGLHLLVLERGGDVVATTYLNVIANLTRSAAPYAVIENVVVEQELRGFGLGKQIMAATLQLAWSLGCYKAMLMTGSKPTVVDPGVKTAYLARPDATVEQAPAGLRPG